MRYSKLPYITVIITAYNRKEFLLNAIKSVTNQTLNKKYYEIIVIKNYNDDIVDDFINKNNIKNILMDGTVGEFLYAGVSASKGEIISFLDDDDLFSKDKLEIMYNKFKNNNNLCYYHNDHIIINEKYEKVDIKLGNSIAVNMSSISIRKSILNLDNLKKINRITDHFMYLSALESDKNIIDDKEKLTYYMFHNSTSHIGTKNINEFIKYMSVNLEHDIKSFIMLDKMFILKKANNYIKQKITNIEISIYIFTKNKKPGNALDVLKKCDIPFSIRFKIFIAYILVRFHYNFRYIIIKKLYSL